MGNDSQDALCKGLVGPRKNLYCFSHKECFFFPFFTPVIIFNAKGMSLIKPLKVEALPKNIQSRTASSDYTCHSSVLLSWRYSEGGMNALYHSSVIHGPSINFLINFPTTTVIFRSENVYS